MTPQPPSLDVKQTVRMILVGGAFFLTHLSGVCPLRGADMPPARPSSSDDSAGLPQPVTTETFGQLLANSPFTRSLGLSDSLILTGVARVDKDVFATLYDTKTFETQVVSHTPNREGWQLMGIGGDPERIHTWSAKIQIRGGEIISIRYQKPPPKAARAVASSGGAGGIGGATGGNAQPLTSTQLEEAKTAAVNYREGFTSDGYPRQPPPEIVEKLSRMNVEQRESINREMLGLRNRGMGMEERRRIYEDMVNRSVQGGR